MLGIRVSFDFRRRISKPLRWHHSAVVKIFDTGINSEIVQLENKMMQNIKLEKVKRCRLGHNGLQIWVGAGAKNGGESSGV